MAILTISRQLGSGSGDMRHCIAETLGYSYVDRHVIFNEFRQVNENLSNWAKEFDQSTPSLWEKHDWSFRRFTVLLKKILLNHAVKDNVVLTGRGSNFLLAGISHAHRIRLVAPMEARVARLVRREPINQDSARKLISKVDRERAGFIRAVYNKDVSDPAYYDEVFDTSIIQVDAVCTSVMETLRSKQTKKTVESQRTLEMRTAAADLEAEIVLDPTLNLRVLKVMCLEVPERKIIVEGIVRTVNQHEQIQMLARNISKDHKVELSLSFRK
jgi:cytidylate kinase